MPGEPTRATPPLVLPVREGYDLWAEIYDDENNPLIALEAPEVERLLGEVQGLDLLDLGCGTGRWSVAQARRGAHVTAVDFSRGMLGRARPKIEDGGVRFVEHDLAVTPLPLAKASFDRVLLCLVLEHIADLRSLLGEVARVLRPGGFAVATQLHPAMNLLGIQARFDDPRSGRDVRPASTPHAISDYVLAALWSGLLPDHLGEHAVDEALVSRSPRAGKYLGWPLLFVMRLRREDRGVR
jgi:SAM-dependent methyltransferase